MSDRQITFSEISITGSILYGLDSDGLVWTCRVDVSGTPISDWMQITMPTVHVDDPPTPPDDPGDDEGDDNGGDEGDGEDPPSDDPPPDDPPPDEGGGE